MNWKKALKAVISGAVAGVLIALMYSFFAVSAVHRESPGAPTDYFAILIPIGAVWGALSRAIASGVVWLIERMRA